MADHRAGVALGAVIGHFDELRPALQKLLTKGGSTMQRLATAVLVLALTAPALATPLAVDYPVGYRKWAHVKSMVIFSDKHPLFGPFGGIHHVYANPEALSAFVKGGTFPEGSVVVFDLLEVKEEDGAYVEGERKVVAVMTKSKSKFKETGGWGFEGFKGDSRTERTVTDPVAQCFTCHKQQQANDFIFSGYRP
jgi:hypothetical protein